MIAEHRPGIDVVMVNYRTPHDAYRFVDSFCESLPEHRSLWVVDVDPVEHGALDLAVSEVPGETGLITWGENVGYARACNDAASLGSRDVIGFFNADTRLSPGLLQTVVNLFALEPGWAVLGPRQVDDHGLIVHGGIFGDEAHPKMRGWKELDRGQYDDVREDAVSVSGSAYFVRRDVWEELSSCPIYLDHVPEADGAFLPTPHYYEETWCSYHARDHGWKVVYYGPLCMVHRWHQASPVGGYAERILPMSQEMFRAACDAHRIAHD